MSNSHWGNILETKGEILVHHRKIINQRDNLRDLEEECQILHNDLFFYIEQAKNEGLEPEEAQDLKEILAEVSSFHR